MTTRAQPLEPEAHPTEPTPRPTPAARILIVDDERGPRESLRMILSDPYEVFTAAGGAEALELLRTESIDLVTIDLKMPGMKGDELMRAIRSELPQIEIIVITGCRSIETAIEGIRHGVFDYLTKPFDIVQVTASVERALARRESRLRMVSFLERIGHVLGRTRETDLVLEELDASPLARERLRSILSEPIVLSVAGDRRVAQPSATEFLEILAETIESRDRFMRGHARRVAFLAGLLADRLCLAREEREYVRIAAFLHDIGKVGAPDELLVRESIPEPEGIESLRAHPEIGERLLRPLGSGTPIARIVRHHHERFDGAGYPDGLRGEDIPLASRIIALADACDAMSCERPDRPARSHEEILAELRAGAGTQFDPGLVSLFCSLIESGSTAVLDEAGPRSAGAAEPARAEGAVESLGDFESLRRGVA
jgi:putative nucleotidyltransferase with HDIG domain